MHKLEAEGHQLRTTLHKISQNFGMYATRPTDQNGFGRTRYLKLNKLLLGLRKVFRVAAGFR